MTETWGRAMADERSEDGPWVWRGLRTQGCNGSGKAGKQPLRAADRLRRSLLWQCSQAGLVPVALAAPSLSSVDSGAAEFTQAQHQAVAPSHGVLCYNVVLSIIFYLRNLFSADLALKHEHLTSTVLEHLELDPGPKLA